MSLRKFFAGIATLAVSLSVVASAAQAGFTDQSSIPSWATSAIDQLVSDGVISGYTDGRFGPNDPLTRAQFAKIAVLASNTPVESSVTSSGFPDVPASHWAAPYVKAAKDAGIIGGYSNGNFGPNDTVTRAQAAKILVGAFGLETHTEKGPNFPDVSSSGWEYDYVETAYYWSVINGYQNGNFGPNDPVTRAQVAVMTVNGQSPTVRPEYEGDDNNDVPVDVLGLSSVEATSSTEVEVTFNMTVDETTAENIANYSITGSELEVTEAMLDSTGKMVTLTTAEQVSGHDYTLTVTDIESADGTETVDDSHDSLNFIGFVTAVSSNTFTVSLSSSSPSDSSIPKNANLVPYLVANFSAGSEEDVKVTKLVIERRGLGADADFDKIYLYDGATRLTNGRNFSSEDHTATFNLYSPIVIPAGRTKAITVTGTMAGNANKINYLQIAFPEDVVAVGATSGGAITVSGSFPISGAEMTTVDVSSGQLVIDNNGAVNDSVKVGDEQAELGLFKMTANNEDILVTTITLENKKSGSEDIENITLYNDLTGEELVSVAIMGNSTNNDQVTFDLTGLADGGLYIKKGNKALLSVKADITGARSTSDQIDLQIDNVSDILGIGQTYGYGVAVDTTTNSVTSLTGNSQGYVSIDATDLVFDWEKPTYTEVASDSTDVVMGILNITNRSEDLLLSKMRFDLDIEDSAGADFNAGTTPETYIDNIELVDPNGVVVAGPATPEGTYTAGDAAPGDYYVDFNDSWLIPSDDDTQAYTLRADIKTGNTEGTNYIFTMRVSTNGTSFNSTYFDAEGNVTGNSPEWGNVTPSSDTGILSNKITVQQSTLSIALSSTPASQTLVAGNEIEVLGFTLTSNDSGDIKVTKIPVEFKYHVDTNTGNFVVDGDATDFADTISSVGTSVKLYTDDGTLLSEKSLASTVSFDSFLSTLTIPSGGQKKLIVKMVTSSSAVANSNYYNKVAGQITIDNITAQDEQGNSLATSQLLPDSATTINTIDTDLSDGDSTSASMTLIKSGTLVAKVDNDTPIANQILFGSKGTELMRINLSATNEDIDIKKLRISMENDNLDSQIDKLYLYDGTDLIGTAQSINTNNTNAGYVEWNLSTSDRIAVPKDGEKILSIKADMNVSNNTGAANYIGQTGKFRIKVAQIEAEGSKADVIPMMKDTSETSEVSGVTLHTDDGGTVLSASATTVYYEDSSAPTVDEATILPGTIIKIDNEYMQVAAIDTTDDSGSLYEGTLTVIRGVNGSTAATHAENNTISSYNIVSNYMIPYDTLPTVALASDPTYGAKGAPSSGMKVFGFTVSAASNTADSRTQKVQINSVTLKVSGTVDVANAALYDATDDSVITVEGESGDHEQEDGTDYITFNLADAADSDREISEGTTKTYYVKADIGTDGSDKSISFAISTLGSISTDGIYTPGHFLWTNKSGSTESNIVTVVKQTPSDITPSPMTFTSSGGSLNADGNRYPKIMAADYQLSGASHYIYVYFDELIDDGAGAAPLTSDFAVSGSINITAIADLDGTTASTNQYGYRLTVDAAPTGQTVNATAGVFSVLTDAQASAVRTITIE